jgi:hypothetical protein
MNASVWAMNLRATSRDNLMAKLGRLVQAAGLGRVVTSRDLVAVKLHFGEAGNTAYVRPVFVREIVQQIKALGGVPFLTDANTLYAGTRSDAAHHLTTALRNGFAYASVEAPLVIADGLRGKSESAVAIAGRRFNSVWIGSEVVQADALVSVAHVKGHELAGFGGTIKNLGMGCASRRGKLAQHSTVSPQVRSEACVGCGECALHCAQAAITLTEGVAQIDPQRCVGCGECILICSNSAIQVQWDQSIPTFLESMVEYTLGVLQGKGESSLFINFLTDISPACDCYAHNDAPIVRNIGVLASADPVAIDQAAVDLINAEPALPGSCLTANTGAGEDKFRGVYPEIAWEHQLAYAEELGLGSRRYTLSWV